MFKPNKKSFRQTADHDARLHCALAAKELTLFLNGNWHGTSGAAACPICQPEGRIDQRALSVSESGDKLLLHCFKSGCGFQDILAVICGGSYSPLLAPSKSNIQSDTKRLADLEKKSQQARRIWQNAEPISGSIAESYLQEARGITCPLPASLRFDPTCWHGPTARRYPAMVARVDGLEGLAVHRTYLHSDGSRKAGLTGGDKLMLGSIRGGAVRLADGAGPLIVGEGIETTLSALILYRDPKAMAWAALSTSGMTALKLPLRPDRLVIAPDADQAGRQAALSLADRAAREGWKVSLLTPPLKGDFNDALRDEVTS